MRHPSSYGCRDGMDGNDPSAADEAIDPDLAVVIRYGAGMLDDVEDAVRRCRLDPDLDADLARTCGTVVSGYLALRDRLTVLPPTALTRRVDELLNYAVLLTDQASLLAFRARDEHWHALAAGFGDGLGAPAEELRRLAGPSRRRFRPWWPLPGRISTAPP